jgi:hypothetical protein
VRLQRIWRPRLGENEDEPVLESQHEPEHFMCHLATRVASPKGWCRCRGQRSERLDGTENCLELVVTAMADVQDKRLMPYSVAEKSAFSSL